MSESKNESKSSFKDWLALAGSVLGFFTALVTFITDFSRLPPDPQALRYVSVAGYILYVLSTLWIVFKADKVKPRWRWASLAVLYIVTAAYFLWLGTWIGTSPTSDWPPDLIAYYDFETDADLKGWSEGVKRSNEHAFSGQYALKAVLPVQADQQTKLSLRWQHTFTADVIVGQIYWPATDEVGIVWAQVCVPLEGWDCAGLLEKHGGWNTFVLDLSEMTVGDPPRPLNQLVLPGLHFQGWLRGATGTNMSTIPIYLDTIQIYRDGQE